MQENLIQQIEEVEALLSIYPEVSLLNEKDFSFLQQLEENGNWSNELPQIRVTFKLENDMHLNVIFPSLYPSEICTYSFHSAHHSNRVKSDFERNITSHHEELLGELCMMEIFEWVRENAPQIQSNTENGAKAETKFRRSFMWTHHLYSKRKKRDLKSFIEKFNLHGFIVSGKPGILVLEGEEMSQRTVETQIKSWAWQKFIVRFSEVDTQQKFSRYTFVDFPGQKSDLAEVRRLLNEVGLGHYYAQLVGVDSFISGDSPKAKSTDATYSFISSKNNDSLISCSVKPNSKVSEIVSMQGKELEIKLAAPPRQGEANKELCKFIAKRLGIGKQQVSLIGGGKSRSKTLRIKNISPDEISARFRS